MSGTSSASLPAASRYSVAALVNGALWFGSLRPASPVVRPDWNRNCVAGESVLKSRTGVFGSFLCSGYCVMSARISSPPERLASMSSTSVTMRTLAAPAMAADIVPGTAVGCAAGAASPVTDGSSAERPSCGFADVVAFAVDACAAGVSFTTAA